MKSTAKTVTASGIGVIIVTYNAEDVILDCLESLMAVKDTPLKIIVVENASQDDTAQVIRDWANGSKTYSPSPKLAISMVACPKPVHMQVVINEAEATSCLGQLTLIHSKQNDGFAGGVNRGLAIAANDPNIEHFWILNPDCITTPKTPARYIACAAANPSYGLMGGRTCYMNPADRIQIDGGTVNLWTGVTSNLNPGLPHATTPPPASTDMEFISGANLLASRSFYEKIGPMREDYFLYYEEVDWAFRRGDFNLVYCPNALVFHHAGTAIGSQAFDGIASPFSHYFKYRSRMKFVRRFRPMALPITYLYAMAKALQLFFKGAHQEAEALLYAIHGLKAPSKICDLLSNEAAQLLFTRNKK